MNNISKTHLPPNNIFLLLLDLKGSTAIPINKSEAIFALLEDFIERMNSELRSDILIPLQLNYGDEISGVFRSPLHCYLSIEVLYEQLKGIIGFRYCVTEGTISFPSSDMTKVGGTAFKRANAIMENRLKKRKRRFCEWALEDSTFSATVTSLANLCFELKERMTTLQWDIYKEKGSNKTITQIARKMKHNANSLYQVNVRSGSEVILDAESQIRILLSDYNSKYRLHDSKA